MLLPPVPIERQIRSRELGPLDIQSLIDNIHDIYVYLARAKNLEYSDRDSIFTRPLAQFDKTNTTYTEVTDMSVTLQNSTLYFFRYTLFLAASAAGGIKFRLNGNLTLGGIRHQTRLYDNTANTLLASDVYTALAAATTVTGPTDMYAIIEGQIQVLTSGIFMLEFAQAIANGTSSILTASTLKLEKMV